MQHLRRLLCATVLIFCSYKFVLFCWCMSKKECFCHTMGRIKSTLNWVHTKYFNVLLEKKDGKNETEKMFLYNNQLAALISQIYFGNETLNVSDSSSVHHQLFTVHSAMVYVIQVCRQLSSRIRMELHSILILLLLLKSCLQTCMTYTMAECTANNSWWWTEELSETCRVSFPK
jgi:hypothetical protein